MYSPNVPTALPKIVTSGSLQSNGIIVGSLLYPNNPPRDFMTHVSDLRVVVRSKQTAQSFALTMDPTPPRETKIVEADCSGSPFVGVLPEGDYEFAGWYLERSAHMGTLGDVTLYDWSTATTPLSIRAGEIRYIGEILIEGPLRTTNEVMNRKESTGNPACAIRNSSERDLQIVQRLYPTVPWNKTAISMELLHLEEPPPVTPAAPQNDLLTSIFGPVPPSPPSDFFPGVRW